MNQVMDFFNKKYITLILLILGLNSISIAQSFIYRPVNPAFGGNPYNYVWMQSQADAQNVYKNSGSSSISGATSTSAISNLSNSLQQQILSQITTQFINNQFSSGSSLKVGTFNYGTFKVDVSNGSTGLNIRVIDNKGTETVVTLPYP